MLKYITNYTTVKQGNNQMKVKKIINKQINKIKRKMRVHSSDKKNDLNFGESLTL